MNTDLIGSWFTFLQPFLVKTKLSVVSVCTTDNPDTLNLLQLIEIPIAGSSHFKNYRFKFFRESDISPLFGKLPSTGFVLKRTMCLFFVELSIPFFPWFVLLAVVIKARNNRQFSFCPSFTCQRIEVFSQLKLTCQYSPICTSLVFTNVFVVHPVSQANLPHKTSSANTFIQLFVLLFRSFEFGFQSQYFYTQIIDLSITQGLVGCLQKLSKKRLHPALFLPRFKIGWSASPF